MSWGRRHWIIVGAGVLLALGLIGWSWGYLDDRRSGAVTALREADACERLARDIAGLRSRGATAGSEPARQTELNRQIARAAADAGLSPRSVERIEHDSPRHAASGNAIEKPTRITIQTGTLPQLAAMFGSLDRPAEGLRLTRIHLAAPNDANDDSAWTAEATLTDTLPANSNTDAATFPR